jgi:photosystem II stability/assembly factor-like uncharacterized protein
MPRGRPFDGAEANVWWARPIVAMMLLAASEVRWVEAAAEAEWVATGLSGAVREVESFADGTLFAQTNDQLLRSGDGGTSWTAVPVPGSPAQVAVDPVDHRTLYAAGAEGLYKSTDEGATWSLVLPTSEFVRAIAISPADRALVYVGLTGSATNSPDFRFLRSRDGGAAWEQLEESHNSLCGWGVRLLRPHPTDPQRVFRTADCYAGRNLSDALRQSLDAGATWADLFEPQLAFPSHLVGGAGAAPGRFYLAANRDSRAGGSSLFRSDDDARTWSEVLAFRGGGTQDQPSLPNVGIGGLAYDPAAPNRVYVGLAGGGRGVRASSDGGRVWADLGGGHLGAVNALALSADGGDLYAATESGLWRHPLGAGKVGLAASNRLAMMPGGLPPGQRDATLRAGLTRAYSKVGRPLGSLRSSTTA